MTVSRASLCGRRRDTGVTSGPIRTRSVAQAIAARATHGSSTGSSGGEFQPPPVQQPRIPVWVAARWPNRRPVRRAARWDGLFPIDLPGPAELAELVAEVPGPPFDVVVTNPAGTDPAPWAAAGATWCLTGFGSQPTEADVAAAIEEDLR